MRFLTLLLLICGCFIPFAGQSQPHKASNFSALKATLEKQHSRSAYDSLHFLLARHYSDLSDEQRKTLRKTLEKHSIWPFETICPSTEPGTKITITGHITDEKGQPIRGAKLHIFHTDQQGYYSPSDATTGRMMEQDPRLEGFLTTDSSGTYEIHTIRPASYPKRYEGRLIPGHVHLNILADGFQERRIQMVFEEDPAMIQYWVEWAHESHYPIVKLVHSGMEVRGEADLELVRL